MLDLGIELQAPLSNQERYEIIQKTIIAANDEGVISQFIFERAFWGYVAEKLVDDIPQEIIEKLYENPIEAFDMMLKEDILTIMFNNYQQFLDYFAESASQYLVEYKEYSLSLGGALSQSDLITGNNLDTLTEQLQEFMNSDNTLKTLDIADSWGMNNAIEKEEKVKQELPKDSLFN